MCGRYHVIEETAEEIEKLIKETDEKLRWESAAALNRISSTDIHPTDQAPVLLAAGGSIACTWLRWGFPVQQEQRKDLIINARRETAMDKPLFREGLLHRRIAVPAASFYEWNREKEQYTFRKMTEKPCLWRDATRIPTAEFSGIPYFPDSNKSP